MYIYDLCSIPCLVYKCSTLLNYFMKSGMLRNACLNNWCFLYVDIHASVVDWQFFNKFFLLVVLLNHAHYFVPQY